MAKHINMSTFITHATFTSLLLDDVSLFPIVVRHSLGWQSAADASVIHRNYYECELRSRSWTRRQIELPPNTNVCLARCECATGAETGAHGKRMSTKKKRKENGNTRIERVSARPKLKGCRCDFVLTVSGSDGNPSSERCRFRRPFI